MMRWGLDLIISFPSLAIFILATYPMETNTLIVGAEISPDTN
jgi:hypothetical protein